MLDTAPNGAGRIGTERRHDLGLAQAMQQQHVRDREQPLGSAGEVVEQAIKVGPYRLDRRHGRWRS